MPTYMFLKQVCGSLIPEHGFREGFSRDSGTGAKGTIRYGTDDETKAGLYFFVCIGVGGIRKHLVPKLFTKVHTDYNSPMYKQTPHQIERECDSIGFEITSPIYLHILCLFSSTLNILNISKWLNIADNTCWILPAHYGIGVLINMQASSTYIVLFCIVRYCYGQISGRSWKKPPIVVTWEADVFVKDLETEITADAANNIVAESFKKRIVRNI